MLAAPGLARPLSAKRNENDQTSINKKAISIALMARWFVIIVLCQNVLSAYGGRGGGRIRFILRPLCHNLTHLYAGPLKTTSAQTIPSNSGMTGTNILSPIGDTNISTVSPPKTSVYIGLSCNFPLKNNTHPLRRRFAGRRQLFHRNFR